MWICCTCIHIFPTQLMIHFTSLNKSKIPIDHRPVHTVFTAMLQDVLHLGVFIWILMMRKKGWHLHFFIIHHLLDIHCKLTLSHICTQFVIFGSLLFVYNFFIFYPILKLCTSNQTWDSDNSNDNDIVLSTILDSHLLEYSNHV